MVFKTVEISVKVSWAMLDSVSACTIQDNEQ